MIGDTYSGIPHAEFVQRYGTWHDMKPERVSFLYLLGILRVTREHFGEIFDVETETIHPECLKRSWVTPLARRTIMLAFNLYTNWMPSEYPEDCSPSALFDNDKIRKFLLIGIEMRYKEPST